MLESQLSFQVPLLSFDRYVLTVLGGRVGVFHFDIVLVRLDHVLLVHILIETISAEKNRRVRTRNNWTKVRQYSRPSTYRNLAPCLFIDGLVHALSV